MKRNLIKICLLTGLLGPCAPLYAAPGASPAVNQQQAVKGHVVDETGEPLIGVTVQVVGKTGGAVTDLDGNFTVNAANGDQLKVSYIGYAEQTVTVNGPTVNIQMKAEDTRRRSRLPAPLRLSTQRRSRTRADCPLRCRLCRDRCPV